MKVKHLGNHAVAARLAVTWLAGWLLNVTAWFVATASGQSTYTWDPATTGTSWLNSANWTGGPANTAPGVSANGGSLITGHAGDVATFGALGFTGSEVGLSFSASANTGVGNNTGANGLLTLGAIDWRSTSRAISLGKSDNLTASGTLRLTGATITPGLAPISNVLASISDGATKDLTLRNTVGTGTGTMAIQLGITAGSFYVTTARNLTLTAGLTELNPGSGLTKLGGGTLTLSGAGSYTGAVTVQSGILAVGSSTALGTSAGGVSVANNAAVSLKNGVTVSGETIALLGTGGPTTAGSGNGALQAAAGASATWNGPVILDDPLARLGAGSGGTLQLAGGVQDGLANVLTVSAASGGTVVLSGTNTYTGATNIMRGTLRLGADNALPTSTILNVDSSNSADTAYFDLAGYNQTVAGLVRGNPAGGGGSLIVTASTASALTVNQAGHSTFSGAITGDIALTKSGAGTLTLSGANAFTGDTVISGGTLAVGSDGLSATASLTVTSGGTLLLTDTGDRVTDAAPVTLAGGTLDLTGLSGESENLGALILSGNSVIDFGSGAGNTLRFTSLSLGANTLSIYHWSGTPYGPAMPSDPGTDLSQDRLLFDTDPGITGLSPQLVFYSDAGLTPIFGGAGHQVAFGSPASAYELVPVPEPGTLCAGLALLALVGWRERRRLLRLLA